MINYLKGKKTYITASLLVVYAILGYYLKEFDIITAIQMVFGAAAVAGVRGGVTTEIKLAARDILSATSKNDTPQTPTN